MDEERKRVARWLVDLHFEVEPDLEEIYVLLGEAEQPIRLLEVNRATIESSRFEAYAFAPTDDVPFKTAIAEVTRDELNRLRTAGALPPEWDLEQAEVFRRPAA